MFGFKKRKKGSYAFCASSQIEKKMSFIKMSVTKATKRKGIVVWSEPNGRNGKEVGNSEACRNLMVPLKVDIREKYE